MPNAEERLDRLFDKYNRPVRAYCRRRLGNEEAADAVADVLQLRSTITPMNSVADGYRAALSRLIRARGGTRRSQETLSRLWGAPGFTG